jgi:phage/plasmid-associated DNA primase
MWVVEGEPNVELARACGIAAMTLQGSNWKEPEIVAMVEALRATGKNIVLVKLRDNDATGIKKGKTVQLVCDRLQFPCIVIDPVAIRADIPEKGDIKEILDAMSPDEFIKRLEAEIHARVGERQRDSGEVDDITFEEKPPNKPPTPREMARELAETYGHLWKFQNEQKCWRVWNGQIWEKAEEGNFATLVKRTIDARNIAYKGSAYLNDVLALLTHDLRQKHWSIWDRKRYIAFANQVLDCEKGEALEFSPGMGFTSNLPYQFKPLRASAPDSIAALQANCPNTYKWMNGTMQGDFKKILKLLAVINGMLKFRFFDLQMFVHLVGKPGSGKGTFARLLQKIVGRENHKGCKISRLEDGSTMASVIDKQLVVCPDERTTTGVDTILSLTGGDIISYREVYKPATDAYFYGTLLICSNHPIFVGDTTGLDRRLCLIGFDNPMPAYLRDSGIEQSMEGEISQLIAISLNLSDALVTELIRGTGAGQIAEFKLSEWEMKVQTNSIAAHFDENLIVDPTASTPTGKLYEHYKNWCGSTLKAVSHIKYPKMLEELCVDYLQIPGVKYKRSGGRSWFEGLRLRAENETEPPTHTDTLSNSIPVNQINTRFNGVSSELARGSEPLSDGNYSDLSGLSSPQCPRNLASNKALTEEVPQSLISQTERVNENVEKKEPVSSNPVNPVESSEPLLDMGYEPNVKPIANPDELHQTPLNVDSELNETELEVVEFINDAISEADTKYAMAIQKIISSVCHSGAANWEKIWLNLGTQKQAAFTGLLNHKQSPIKITKGLKVVYVGDRPACKAQYGCQVLIVEQVSHVDGVTCKLPSGQLTTWLQFDELKLLVNG